MIYFPVIGVVLVFGIADAAKTLPSELMRCKEEDLECLKTATQGAIPNFVKGIQSLGVLSIDPLVVTEMTLAQGHDSPVNINLHFKNETITGFSQMTINSVSGRTKLDDYNLVFKVHIPTFQMIGDYTVSGKVMLLPVTGSGYSNLTLTNMNVEADIMGKPKEKNGEKYLDVTDFKLNIEPSRLYMRFDNLFNGDPALGSHMNNFLNDNWDAIYKELKPTIEDTFGAIFQEISNRIFSRVPYKNIVL